jgi:hypothetical protein
MTRPDRARWVRRHAIVPVVPSQVVTSQVVPSQVVPSQVVPSHAVPIVDRLEAPQRRSIWCRRD